MTEVLVPTPTLDGRVSLDRTFVDQIGGVALQTTGNIRRSTDAKSRLTTTIHPADKVHQTNKMPLASNRTSPKKSTSLKRAKNNTDAVGEKTNRVKKVIDPPESPPDTRNGRNFTIGNVGTGGTLYLRPSPLPRSPPQSPKNGFTNAMPPIVHVLMQNGDQFTPVETFTSSKPLPSPATTPRLGARRIARDDTDLQTSVRRIYRGRSQSISTIEEHRASLSAARSRRLRIVINRPEADELDENGPHDPLPLLQVPIPHYKIGTPRFSTQGTPTLRASGFSLSRASALASEDGQSIMSAQVETLFPAPPGAYGQGLARGDGKPPNMTAPQKPWTLPLRRALSTDTSTTRSTMRGPTQSQVYDELEEMYDDPSVVRYSQNVREITAATPARIIAQISSESFMDYELVSDFFLTFRSYMTTYSVLGYLLARLRWAIGRQEDTGKIVRVRTFAALRHWILNYFADDFIPDRELRVQFCDGINKLYVDIRKRFGYDASNLKVLRDLKRCWNGRCSLHWESSSFSVEGSQDEPLLPGENVEDLQDPADMMTQTLGLHMTMPTPTVFPSKKPSTDASWLDVYPDQIPEQTLRNPLSPGRQESTISDGSLQPISCSLPKDLLRSPNAAVTRFARPQLVSVQSRRKNAPSNLQVSTHASPPLPGRSHRRGASSIDSNRDQTPRTANTVPKQVPAENLSLIRGTVIQPGSPFVKVPQSPVPPSTVRPDFDLSNPNGVKRMQLSPSGGTPGMKNILGSLRKALGGRHAHSEVALVTVSGPLTNPHLRNKRSNLPLNLSKSYDELRTKTVSVVSKPQIRIDLLCAAVAQSYAAACAAINNQTEPKRVVSPVKNDRADLDPEQQPLNRGLGLGEDLLRRQRFASNVTAQSGSILIVDDTRPDLPLMTGALASWPTSNQHETAETASIPSVNQLLPTQAKANDHHSTIMTQRSSDVLGTSPNNSIIPTARPTSSSVPVTPGPRVPTRTSSALDTRLSSEAAKDQNQVQHAKSATDSTVRTPISSDEEQSTPRTTVSQLALTTESGKNILTGVRRLPGGDLRAAEHIHQLNLPSVPESKPPTAPASPSASLIIMGNRDTTDIAEASPAKAVPRVSMINTHSSQHLRPSFEAAVGGFSAIPDDDDGGLEATLLKLEGRYEKKSPTLSQQSDEEVGNGALANASVPPLDGEVEDKLLDGPTLGSPFKASKPPAIPTRMSSDEGDDGDATSARRSSIFGMPLEHSHKPHGSQDSVPLLKRETLLTTTESSHPSSKQLQSPSHVGGSTARVPNEQKQSTPRPQTSNDSTQSFFMEDDEDDKRTDLSSEISVDIINYSDVVDRSISPMIAAPGTAISGLEIPSHPLTYVSGVNLNIPPEKPIDEFSPSLVPQPLKTYHGPRPAQPSSIYPETPAAIVPSMRLSTGPAHYPFILAGDSQTLAQQFTLIEKSALGEVEWSDLVEMRWDNKSADILNWAEYLLRPEVKGIDLVITRFNLVVKWALSEIVLTQDVRERAQVITKLIHVAAHARRLRNYATMLQLTIALTSTDCTRLTTTWDLVSGPDRSLLKNMESLMQPVRNFQDLRTEMESADVSEGCIPFIGLYVHDLTYNAQKPSHITSRHGGEDLVNFERFRTAAVIVKGLLRLIDASSRYDLVPLEGTIERCLWLASLSDERIRHFSEALEA